MTKTLVKFFDTHTHVHFEAFKDDLEDVLRRAQEAGVGMVTVGTQSTTSKRAIEVAEAHDHVWATVGLHPNHTVKQTFHDPNEVQGNATVKTREEVFDTDSYRALASHPKCVAIGECGFDFYRIPEDADRNKVIWTQEEMLRRQFDLATELELPLVIHCRDAHKEQADLMEEYVRAGKIPRRGVMHCFTGTQEDADRYLSLGFYISFSGVVTFPARKDLVGPMLIDVAKTIPDDKILIETDAPYLAPEPMRGKRNEPAYVVHTAEFLARARGVSIDAFARQTTENAKRLFRI